jgi:hypothetical protein
MMAEPDLAHHLRATGPGPPRSLMGIDHLSEWFGEALVIRAVSR